MKHIIFIFSLSLFLGCTLSEPKEHIGFSKHCDCFVYENDVITEIYSFGKVDIIDKQKANNCAKEQLKNAFYLNYDSIGFIVYNIHPKIEINQIKIISNKYSSDTTKIESIVSFKDYFRVTIERFYSKNLPIKSLQNKYISWKVLTLSKKYPFKEIEESILLENWK